MLNRADGKVGLSADEYESTLGLKADCSLVSSREVLAAVNRGEALVRAYSGHPNSKAIVAFSKDVTAALGAAADGEGDRQPEVQRLPVPPEEGLT